MRLPRGCGILLHPTSLPSRFGIGDLGPEADAFIDFLAETGQRWWQMLPVGPTGYGNSPYQSHSSYAGNRLLISPEWMAAEGWLSPKDWADYPELPRDRVDYDAVAEAKERLFRRAFARFGIGDEGFQPFLRDNLHWLDDYALYLALKKVHGDRAWNDWESEIAARRPEALARWREELAEEVRYYQFIEYIFYKQWQRLRDKCRTRGIGLIGDLPIFVSQDSSDVWARPDLFQLDERGRPTHIAGVPPDYFSETGQLWGNPLYRWEAHAAENFAWWIARLKATTDRFDLVRLDHFRGFEAYWEVPADSPTAASGRWALGPGHAFLEAVRHALGGLPLIAEDLGNITFEVEALRDQFGLPGMKVLQFAFGNDPMAEVYLPYRYPNHCIVYTGTHDNDTTVGWFSAEVAESTQTPEEVAAERAFVRRYLGTTGEEIHWDLIRLAFGSVADTVIIPMQDILGLGSEARMNIPGRAEGNWAWRMAPGQLDGTARARLADLTAVYARWNGEVPVHLRSPRRPKTEPTYLGR
ncbi:MAG: 4-alpha-glucanotransferase [Isosphaeraceae bacterium]|nr:4-alpha-glucanotransferase [Isosphaeraceae bacterium]